MARKSNDLAQTQFMVKPEHLGIIEDLAGKMQILCDARAFKGRQVAGGNKMLHMTCWGPPQALQMFFYAASQQVQTRETPVNSVAK